MLSTAFGPKQNNQHHPSSSRCFLTQQFHLRTVTGINHFPENNQPTFESDGKHCVLIPLCTAVTPSGKDGIPWDTHKPPELLLLTAYNLSHNRPTQI